MNTVLEILHNAFQINYGLKLKSIVVIFYQAIYAKAIKISWKHPTLFHDVTLRIDVFHTIGVLLEVIGNHVGDAGLRDIVIELNVIEEGSVKKVLSEKCYNQGVRFHKLFFEACMRF